LFSSSTDDFIWKKTGTLLRVEKLKFLWKPILARKEKLKKEKEMKVI